jgi:hypothetical protein
MAERETGKWPVYRKTPPGRGEGQIGAAER